MGDERVYLRLEDGPVFTPGPRVIRDVAVDRRLAPHVSNIEVYREHFTTPLEETVIPDGATRLLFDLRDQRAWIIGVADQPVKLALDGEVAHVTVTLRPGAAHELLGVPSGALRNQFMPLKIDVVPMKSDAGFCAAVQRQLLEWSSRRARTERRRVSHALQLLKRSTVRSTAAALCLSTRRLQQLFDAELGLSPRLWRRLARVHECVKSLRDAPLSDLALAHGFYDQAHLANEFRELLGMSPTQLISQTSKPVK